MSSFKKIIRKLKKCSGYKMIPWSQKCKIKHSKERKKKKLLEKDVLQELDVKSRVLNLSSQ